LQLAKAADKVSDAAQLSSDLNDVKAITDVEKSEDEPGADAIRGALSIRRFSTVRRAGRATSVDTGGAIPLPNWRRGRDGHSEWTRRESTIREVPSEEERKSSIHFDPKKPGKTITSKKSTCRNFTTHFLPSEVLIFSRLPRPRGITLALIQGYKSSFLLEERDASISRKRKQWDWLQPDGTRGSKKSVMKETTHRIQKTPKITNP